MEGHTLQCDLLTVVVEHTLHRSAPVVAFPFDGYRARPVNELFGDNGQRADKMRKPQIKISLVQMVCFLLSFATFVNGQSTATKGNKTTQVENRCGWFFNPTPANAFFYDRDGEWIIGLQGGYQAEGDWPAFEDNQWVKTNINYGYGCACMRLLTNRKTKEVIKIESARVRPLSTCRKDQALKKWKFK